MGRHVIPDERLPEKVQEVIRSMEDSCTSEGTTTAELINDVATSSMDAKEDSVQDAMQGALDELIEWGQSAKKQLAEAFKP